MQQMKNTTMSGKSNKYPLLHVGAFLAMLIALLIPVTAFAIPGSGDFVALYADTGREITNLYNLIAKICLAILILVEGVLLYAIIKFRRRDDNELPVQNHGDLRLEFGWTLAALVIQVWIGVATINVMFSTETEPEQVDMTVQAIAYQWDWQFVYPDHGGLTHTDLVVPAHTTIKLEVTSRDVLHAIFIPELGIKMDTVPGRFNYWWFRADGPVAQVRAENFTTIGRAEATLPQTRPEFFSRGDRTARATSGLERRVTHLGRSRQVEEVSPYARYNAIEYQGVCAELCGFGHWDMYFRAVVMTPSSFNRWLRDMETMVTEPDPAGLYASQCSVCHGDEGQGLANNPALVGSSIVALEEGKSEHIEIVLNGRGAMPPFATILNDAEVAAVVNHERISWGNDGGTVEDDAVAELRESLGLSPYPAGGVEPTPVEELLANGERIYRSCVTCHGADGVGPDFIPSLAGSDLVLGDTEPLVELLVNGRDLDQWPGYKSPLAESMTDFQLASILTYIRSSFGNEAGEVQPFDVAQIRRDLN